MQKKENSFSFNVIMTDVVSDMRMYTRVILLKKYGSLFDLVLLYHRTSV